MSESALELLVVGLAVWRVSSLLTYERGPFHIFEWVRSLAGIKHNDTGKVVAFPNTYWGELLSCVWCISPYIALIATVLYYVLGSAFIWACLPFALSALAILTHKYAR